MNACDNFKLDIVREMCILGAAEDLLDNVSQTNFLY